MKNKFFGNIALAAIIGFSMAACGTGGDNGNGNSDENLIFNEDFNGSTLDSTKWAVCPNWDRQGGSTWMDDMVSVSGGYLHLKFKRDATLGKGPNWIRAGAIRTRSKDWSKILFENTFGYYEAKIKFPVVDGTWGAFWLMSPTQGSIGNGGVDGTEIDIVETIGNTQGKYNAALHWDGYPSQNVGSNNLPNQPVNIYDGEFHIFGLEWKQDEYIFYVDDVEFWRVDGGSSFKNCGINQTPNYIKLTVEASLDGWAGSLPAEFTEDEMLVDYVRVYKQKPE